MSERSKIEWTDSTFNWWEGCTKVGPGCDNCYAENRNARFGGGQSINWGPGAPRRLTSETNRNNLRRWNNRQFYECRCCGWRGDEHDKEFRTPRNGCIHDLMPTRRRVFCSSLSDVFDNEVPQEWRDAMFAEMEACTRLDFLVLTKRIGNVRKMVPASWLEPGGWPAHVRIGATIVNQPEADRDIAKLLALPCPNFLSMEPLCGPVDLTALPHEDGGSMNVLTGEISVDVEQRGRSVVGRDRRLDWVIVGGETQPGARPMHPTWVQGLRDQCEAAGVPFLFKQWGDWWPTNQMTDGEGRALYVSNKKAGPDEDQSVLDDVWGRRCKVPNRAVHLDGSVHDILEPNAWPTGAMLVFHAGKAKAGRHLDGRTHDGFPS